MLGEGRWQSGRIAMPLGTCRKLRQVRGTPFGLSQPKREIRRKSSLIASDLLVEAAGRYSVEAGENCILLLFHGSWRQSDYFPKTLRKVKRHHGRKRRLVKLGAITCSLVVKR